MHDVGSKYHKLHKWHKASAFTFAKFICYRPNLFAYDVIYNKSHATEIASDPDFEIKDQCFTSFDVKKGEAVFANDCIWYKRVFEELLDSARQGADVYITNFIYR